MSNGKIIRAKVTSSRLRKPLKANAPEKRARTARRSATNKSPTLEDLLTMDRNSPKFKAELRREARNIAKAPDHDDVMNFIESLYEDWE